MGAKSREPLKPIDMIVLWCAGSFRGVLAWVHMMPRDDSLSDSYIRCPIDVVFPTDRQGRLPGTRFQDRGSLSGFAASASSPALCPPSVAASANKHHQKQLFPK